MCNTEFLKEKPHFPCKICGPKTKQYQRKGYLIKHLEQVQLQSDNLEERNRAAEELEVNKTAEKLI